MMEINMDSGVDPTQQFVCNVDFHPMEWGKINNSMPVSDESMHVWGERWNSPHFFFPEKVTHPIIRESNIFNGFLLFGNWKNALDVEFPTNYSWTFANCKLFDKGIGKYLFVSEGHNDIEGYTYINTMNYGKGNIYSIYIQNDSNGFFSFNNKTMNTSHMFENCQSLNIFSKDNNSLTNMELNEAADMSYMFANSYLVGSSRACLGQSNTNEFRVYAFNTSGMFYNCRKFDCSNRLDIEVVDASYMFYGCSNLGLLGKINLSSPVEGSQNTFTLHSSITNASYMFAGCINMDLKESINMEFGLSHILDASYMFAGCSNMTNLAFKCGNHIWNSAFMFSGCSNIFSMTLNCGGMVNLCGMFEDCSNLDCGFQGESGQDLNFDVTKARDLSRMFNNCRNLNFGGSYDPSLNRVHPSRPINCTCFPDGAAAEVNASYMFANCRNLNMHNSITLIFGGGATFNLAHAFEYTRNFNSRVVLRAASNLSYAFFESNYNQPVGDIVSINDCSYMFAKFFDLHHTPDQPIRVFDSYNSDINLIGVHNISHMFDNAETFDRLLDFRDESTSITNMSGLFYGNWSTYNHDIFVPGSCTDASLLFGVWLTNASTGDLVKVNFGARNFINRNIYINSNTCNIFGLLPSWHVSQGEIRFNVFCNDIDYVRTSNILGTETTWAQLPDGSYVNYYYGVKLWNYWPEEIVLH